MIEKKILDLESFTKKIKIQKITIESCEFEKKQDLFPNKDKSIELAYGFKAEDNCFDKNDEILSVTQPINFFIRSGSVKKKIECDEDGLVLVFDLKVKYLITFKIPMDTDEDLIQQYIENRILKIINPYVRELIFSILGRVGFPAVALPLFEGI